MTGRKILFVITVSLFGVLGILSYFFGADNIWHMWGVPTLSPGFADLRDVLRGIESARTESGNPADPFGLIGGYPGIWAMLGWLGINLGDVLWIAFIILCLYWISLFLFARDYDAHTALWMSVVVFSPAAMLGYERGNLDLLIFVLLSIALAVDSFSRILSVGLVSLAAMLKIFPIAGLSFLLKEQRSKFLFWMGLALAIFIIYAVSIRHTLRGIVGYIPKGALFDYGAQVIGFHIFMSGGSRSLSNAATLLAFALLYVLILAMLYLSHLFPLRSHDENQQYIDSFRLGATIYIGTFAEGNSFNYRLIFLLFCIPQIILWMHSSSSIHFATRLALDAVITSCWGALLLKFLPVNLAFALDELVNWVLFATLLYLFFVSLPDWLLKEIDGFFQRHRFGRRNEPPESSSNNT